MGDGVHLVYDQQPPDDEDGDGNDSKTLKASVLTHSHTCLPLFRLFSIKCLLFLLAGLEREPFLRQVFQHRHFDFSDGLRLYRPTAASLQRRGEEEDAPLPTSAKLDYALSVPSLPLLARTHARAHTRTSPCSIFSLSHAAETLRSFL